MIESKNPGGSSPLTRGQRRLRFGRSSAFGLIPAHAGKTPTSCSAPADTEAHPRSRGENGTGRTWPRTGMGSSPLTRGKPCSIVVVKRYWGLIPAHAGKTRKERAARSTQQAHPRSRGENDTDCPMSFSFRGSSPLTRGKPHNRPRRQFIRRLIPAHAGKTDATHEDMTSPQAHPRSRGENGREASACGASWGSSPLTRGKLESGRRGHRNTGRIPAHAGKTAKSAARGTIRAAHPRSRGENGRLWRFMT